MRGTTSYDSQQDLKEDDDLLSDLLLDTLGLEEGRRFGVHKTNQDYVSPVYDRSLVQALVSESVCRLSRLDEGLDRLLKLPVVQKYLARKRPAQLKCFKSQATLYLELYQQKSRVEIGRTSRYTFITGKQELAIYATSSIPEGTRLSSELRGGLAPLTVEEEAALGGSDNDEIREVRALSNESSSTSEDEVEDQLPVGRAVKDFSTVWLQRVKRHAIFLGPARFMNHDCSSNTDLVPSVGGFTTFVTNRTIRLGEELTTYYGEDYFGPENTECLCRSCEEARRGHYSTRPSSSALPPPSHTPDSTRQQRHRALYDSAWPYRPYAFDLNLPDLLRPFDVFARSLYFALCSLPSNVLPTGGRPEPDFESDDEGPEDDDKLMKTLTSQERLTFSRMNAREKSRFLKRLREERHARMHSVAALYSEDEESDDEAEGREMKKRKLGSDEEELELDTISLPKHSCSLIVGVVAGVTISRTDGEATVPLVNLTPLLKLAGVKKGLPLQAELRAAPRDHLNVDAGPERLQGTWVPLKYAAWWASNHGLCPTLQEFFEEEPTMGTLCM